LLGQVIVRFSPSHTFTVVKLASAENTIRVNGSRWKSLFCVERSKVLSWTQFNQKFSKLVNVSVQQMCFPPLKKKHLQNLF